MLVESLVVSSNEFSVAPRSRDTYPDACPKIFRPYCLIFFQYLLLDCDYLYYCVSDLDSQI